MKKSDFISIWGTSNSESVFISIKDPDEKNVWNESLSTDDQNKFSTLDNCRYWWMAKKWKLHGSNRIWRFYCNEVNFSMILVTS